MDKIIEKSKFRIVLKAFLKSIPEPITALTMNLADEFEKVESEEDLARFEDRLNAALNNIEIEEHQVSKIVDNKIKMKYLPVKDDNVIFYPFGGTPQYAKSIDSEKPDFTVFDGLVEFYDKELFEDVAGILVYHRKYDARLRIKD